jgi:hypothetical protein
MERPKVNRDNKPFRLIILYDHPLTTKSLRIFTHLNHLTYFMFCNHDFTALYLSNVDIKSKSGMIIEKIDGRHLSKLLTTSLINIIFHLGQRWSMANNNNKLFKSYQVITFLYYLYFRFSPFH